MIWPAEIQKKANRERVRDTQIEKDYILTWILTGVAANDVMSKALAIKGGTVLKKFYFKDYRYSEDLDFTLVDDSISNEAIQDAFKEAFQYVREEANIPLAMEDFGIHETGNINFYITYVGPLGGAGANKRVKVDISRTEKLCFKLENLRDEFAVIYDLIKKYLAQKKELPLQFVSDLTIPHNLPAGICKVKTQESFVISEQNP